MPVTVEALELLFTKPNSYGDFGSFEFDQGIGKFVGHVVHHEFAGLSIPERQKRVWERLKDQFGDEAQEVSLVLTFSPAEWEEVGQDDKKTA